MKKLTKKQKRFIKFPLFIILIIAITWLIFPITRPAWLIRMHMLILTPKGTSMERVIEVVENNDKWRIWNINYKSGHLNRAGARRISGGTQSIRVFHGDYTIAAVSVFYSFDEEGKLIDIGVWKDYGP
jgi:hypothetical protein